ncbi:MAG: DUF1127 domain-containing protein [Amylibacter sp.]|jgi:uncharacterized protein YjiS (DUF1127 family)|nr:DUF1127 domain-containing protein [Amylibacter sp.]
MAYFTNTTSHPFGSITIFRITNFIEINAEKAVKWYQTRQTKIVLSKLTDRELNDIGLSRSDINNI